MNCPNKPRKISSNIECPFTNFIYFIIDITKNDVIFKKLNFSPNIITTISFFFGILSSYFLYNNNNKIAIILHLLAYYFDCLDGYFARKYNMCTIFGDYYDHITDAIKFCLTIFILYIKNKEYLLKYLKFIILFLLLSVTHLGCQENIYDGKESNYLRLCKKLCFSNYLANYLRYFGCGMYQLFISFIMYYS